MRRIHSKYHAYLFLIIVVSLHSCYFGGSEYSSLVKKELAKGVRHDSLFMGIYLGMTSKQFYSHCWELNKKGLFTNGSTNTTVLYKLGKELRYPAAMDFYPDFYNDTIFAMKVSYQYDAWAPWNKPLFADSLLPDIVRMYKKWYPAGNDFITMTDKIKGTIYVKVDGNRRITIGHYNDVQVKVDYTDLLIEQKLKK